MYVSFISTQTLPIGQTDRQTSAHNIYQGSDCFGTFI